MLASDDKMMAMLETLPDLPDEVIDAMYETMQKARDAYILKLTQEIQVVKESLAQARN